MSNAIAPAHIPELPKVNEKLLEGKTILVTGGTGSFGRHFVRRLLKTKIHKIIVFSRDELKQSEMQNMEQDPKDRLRYFIGDVRDRQRLNRAFSGVDCVIHAAALKQVPALEYNPFEAVLTNIMGSQNVVDAAIDQGVKRVIALSTDKAVNPVNLYGATKLCAEKLFIDGNSYAGTRESRFSVVRYGNVVGSRGSVIPLFLRHRNGGELPITDDRMTRFFITLDQGVEFVLMALSQMMGGEIFVPKIPSIKIVDLARAIAPKARIRTVGIRPGEKIHEVLITEDESSRTLDIGPFFIIEPLFGWWTQNRSNSAKRVPGSYRYSSDSNEQWLGPGEMQQMVLELERQNAEKAMV